MDKNPKDHVDGYVHQNALVLNRTYKIKLAPVSENANNANLIGEPANVCIHSEELVTLLTNPEVLSCEVEWRGSRYILHNRKHLHAVA